MMYALVDCNNFYASCERAFQPRLENKPIIVLSNNDGCVVARSNEAKTLGIRMGEPYFKCKDICVKNKVHVFSSNYELYGEMSSRVMSSLEEFCPELEIYSIDEAFLSFDSFNNFNLMNYSKIIRESVKARTGIPVSIGFAPTKTLAKIANHVAKKHTTTGVFSLCDLSKHNQILHQFPVEDIWGVGRRIAARLKVFNILTAQDLKDSDPKVMRREFSVVMEKMIAELNGESCLPLEEVQPPKKQIMSSRSFGSPIITLPALEEAISTYAARACIKLRAQNSLASGIYVFLHTNVFRQDQRQYANSYSRTFTHPTADTRHIISEAKISLKNIFKAGYQYKKAGIMLLHLIPNTIQQFDLLDPGRNVKSEHLMKMVDAINQRYGKKSISFCAEGINHSWAMRREKISKRYTTNWKELPIANCK